MSYTSLLVHSCRIDRGVPGAPDKYGHEAKVYDPGETVACLIQGLRAEEVQGPALGGQVISDVRIYLQPSVVLAEQDQIVDVTAGHLADLYNVEVVDRWDYGTRPHVEVLARNIGTGEVS